MPHGISQKIIFMIFFLSFLSMRPSWLDISRVLRQFWLLVGQFIGKNAIKSPIWWNLAYLAVQTSQNVSVMTSVKSLQLDSSWGEQLSKKAIRKQYGGLKGFEPLGFLKNRKKISNILKKISLIKNVHMDQKWSHSKVLGKYFEVYGQARPITPEARKKKAPF